jgi:hypothetical protein
MSDTAFQDHDRQPAVDEKGEKEPSDDLKKGEVSQPTAHLHQHNGKAPSQSLSLCHKHSITPAILRSLKQPKACLHHFLYFGHEVPTCYKLLCPESHSGMGHLLAAMRDNSCFLRCGSSPTNAGVSRFFPFYNWNYNIYCHSC